MVGQLFVDEIKLIKQELDSSIILSFRLGLDERLMIFDLSWKSWGSRGRLVDEEVEGVCK